MSHPPSERVTVETRERALLELSEHLSSGRLSLAEYDERAVQVTQATTIEQLAAVFADLPGVKPPAAPPPPANPAAGYALMCAVATVVLFLFAVIFGGWWWIFLVLGVLGTVFLLVKASPKLRAQGLGGQSPGE